MPSFGTALNFTSSTNNTYNWNTFVGTDDPDSTRRIRIYNDLNTYINIGERFVVGAGVDFGFQQESRKSTTWDRWYGTAVNLSYSTDKVSVSLRYEYYHDPQEVIVTSLSDFSGYKTSGISLNIDRRILDFILVRVEGRYFTAPDQIYPDKEQLLQTTNFFLLGSVALNWNKIF